LFPPPRPAICHWSHLNIFPSPQLQRVCLANYGTPPMQQHNQMPPLLQTSQFLVVRCGVLYVVRHTSQTLSDSSVVHQGINCMHYRLIIILEMIHKCVYPVGNPISLSHCIMVAIDRNIGPNFDDVKNGQNIWRKIFFPSKCKRRGKTCQKEELDLPETTEEERFMRQVCCKQLVAVCMLSYLIIFI
jgi:hypothetical protein